ncbi:MAG: amidase domain-containing protein [Clostridiaceae bacterium]
MQIHKFVKWMFILLLIGAMLFSFNPSVQAGEMAIESRAEDVVVTFFETIDKQKYTYTNVEDELLEKVIVRENNLLKKYLKDKIKLIQQRRKAFNLDPNLIERNVNFIDKINGSDYYEFEIQLTDTYAYSGQFNLTKERTEFYFKVVQDKDGQMKISEFKSDDPIDTAYLSELDLSKALLADKSAIEVEKKIFDSPVKPFISNPVILAGSLISFDRKAMVQYAVDNAYSRPSNWGNFDSPNGKGDCTNFTSQIIYKGTGNSVMDRNGDLTWYYGGYSDRSTSWTSVNYLYDYLVRNTGQGPQGYLATSSVINAGMQLGDVVQIDLQNDGIFDHSTTIVYYQNGAPQLTRIACHTSDASDKLLVDYPGNKRWVHLTGFER